MAKVNLNKSFDFYYHSIKVHTQEAQNLHQLKSPLSAQIYLVKILLNVNIVKQDLLHKKQFLKILWSVVWKGGFQLKQILSLLGMYFDAAVVEVKTFLLLFRLALAILCDLKGFTLWNNFNCVIFPLNTQTPLFLFDFKKIKFSPTIIINRVKVLLKY